MEDLLWKFCNSSPMLLCRVTKFPSLNFQCLFLREKILLLVSPISLTRFQFLTFVRESKGLFWIFDMSTSLYTSRSLIRNYSLFKFYLKPATLRFSQTTENFSLSLRILAMGFQNIFSSVCSLSGSLQLHIFLHQFEAITEIVEESGHPYGYFLDDSLRGGTQCFSKLTV